MIIPEQKKIKKIIFADGREIKPPLGEAYFHIGNFNDTNWYFNITSITIESWHDDYKPFAFEFNLDYVASVEYYKEKK